MDINKLAARHAIYTPSTVGQFDVSAIIKQGLMAQGNIGMGGGQQPQGGASQLATAFGGGQGVPKGGSLGAMSGGVNPQAIAEGVNAIEGLLRQSQAEGGIRDAWQPTFAALKVAKAIPDPVVAGVALIGEILTRIVFDIFGDKPCEFTTKKACTASRRTDGSVYGDGECCNPFDNATGKGVMVTEHAVGYKRYPGEYTEIPAGDYYNLTGIGVPREYRVPAPLRAGSVREDLFTVAPKVFGRNVDSMLVPRGWQVQAFSQPGFKGTSKTFGPGFIDMRKEGFRKGAASLRVRGNWSIIDRLNAEALKEKRSGWVTENAETRNLDDETILTLIGLDPLRPKTPGYQEYLSVWRPGWFLRLSEAGVIDSRPIQIALKKLGFDKRDLLREKAISMEQTLDTLQLLKRAERIGDPGAAKNLVETAFNVRQKEIAQILSKYKLDDKGIDRLIQSIGDELKSAKAQLGVARTDRLSREATEVAVQAIPEAKSRFLQRRDLRFGR